MIEKKISIRYIDNLEKDTMVLANEFSLLNTVVSNIISNAIKFSLPGGSITVEAYESDLYVRLEFRDNGLGIPDKILHHLFDAGKPTTRLGTAGETGTGFGLPLVKSFMDRFNGKIAVESKSADEYPQCHGTTFTLYLKKVS